MDQQTLVKKTLPQRPDVEVLVPNYKEPILPVNHGGFGWFGLQAYNEQGQLMCHECGEFHHTLSNHIQMHGLTVASYRERYQLQPKTKLVSPEASAKRRAEWAEVFRKHPEFLEAAKARGPINFAKRKRRPAKQVLEFYNRNGTCEAQILDALQKASAIYGDSISQAEVNHYCQGLGGAITRRFGSLNKAKQILKLRINIFGHQAIKYTRAFLVEDACLFFAKHNRWPQERDYGRRKHLLQTSYGPVKHNGGLMSLRQEAMQLLEDRNRTAQRVNQAAANIEMEMAGRARR